MNHNVTNRVTSLFTDYPMSRAAHANNARLTAADGATEPLPVMSVEELDFALYVDTADYGAPVDPVAWELGESGAADLIAVELDSATMAIMYG